jgi:hypothetical protein
MYEEFNEQSIKSLIKRFEEMKKEKKVEKKKIFLL